MVFDYNLLKLGRCLLFAKFLHNVTSNKIPCLKHFCVWDLFSICCVCEFPSLFQTDHTCRILLYYENRISFEFYNQRSSKSFNDINGDHFGNQAKDYCKYTNKRCT